MMPPGSPPSVTMSPRHGVANVPSYEFISVNEAAILLDKGHKRIYRMIDEGLLTEVGFFVLRTEKGRIWVGIPTYGHEEPVFAERKDGS